MGPTERPSFIIENTDNPHVKIFHTRMILTEHVMVGVSRCEQIVENVEGILDFVMRLQGVVQVQVEPYRMTVVKAPAFDWSEIEPKIVSLLRFSKIPDLLRYSCPGLQEEWLKV